jgi:hypothetical protein
MVLEEYQTLRAWVQAGQGGALFERIDQIQWFIRGHREELIRSKAFLPGRGSRPSLVNDKFAGVVARIVKREAGLGEVG